MERSGAIEVFRATIETLGAERSQAPTDSRPPEAFREEPPEPHEIIMIRGRNRRTDDCFD